MTYNYVSTVAAVATLASYFDTDWNGTASTLTPATGIYTTLTGSTKMSI